MDALDLNSILERNDIEKKIENVLTQFTTNKFDVLQKRGIYVYGAPGTGKTSFVMNLLKRLNYDIIKYDAGDIRNKHIIDTITKDNMSDKNIVSMFYKKVKPIAIVMDEIDGMNNGDKGGINSLIKLMRPKKTKKQKTEEITYNPIICIGNYHIDKKIKELMKVCVTFEIKLPTDKQINTIIEHAMPDLEIPLKQNINSFLQGNLRKLSSLCEIYQNHHSILKNEIIQKIFKPNTHNENTKDIARNIVNTPHPIEKHLLVMNETDRTIVGLLWHENIIDVLEGVDKAHSVPFYTDILEKISFADFVDRNIFQKQIWQLNEMSSLLKTFQCNSLYHTWKHKSKQQLGSDVRFTKVLTKYSTEYNNTIFMNNLSREIGVDKKDLFTLFIKLREKYNTEEEIVELFESCDVGKLDISRIYRYIDKYKVDV